MSVEVRILELGESVVEATISGWLREEGQPVEAGDPLAELETDKVNVEVTAERTVTSVAGNSRDHGRSVAGKVVAILSAFADQHEISNAEIARLTGLLASTAYRLLRELVVGGLFGAHRRPSISGRATLPRHRPRSYRDAWRGIVGNEFGTEESQHG